MTMLQEPQLFVNVFEKSNFYTIKSHHVAGQEDHGIVPVVGIQKKNASPLNQNF